MTSEDGGSLPDSTTLGEAALAGVSLGSMSRLAALSRRRAALVVRFVRWDRGREEEMPYTETLGEFRRLARPGLARAEVGDGSGGVPARLPEFV